MAYLDELQKQRQELDPIEKKRLAEMRGESPIIDVQTSQTGNVGMTPQQKQGFDKADMASLATTGATGAAMGGPAGAAIAVGGQLASTYIANKAASERARRERAAQIAQQYGEDQYKGFQMAQQALQGALR